MYEPCTNRMVPAGPEGSPAYFSNRNRRTSPFWVQCSSPRIVPDGATGLFMLGLRTFRWSRGREPQRHLRDAAPQSVPRRRLLRGATMRYTARNIKVVKGGPP